ncbi:PAS domain S-box protein [Okeania sp. SIO2B3]|uniref:PAS domain S-box protein n=1 Tax=Okeania sp. SIO2B3 TaxID=2607784 RepID=UPI0013BF931E|nr:PAS domain S-box protein [Okeania sp. SIO2B3]NET46133.1 PAS domain S-box protein [Okeania sp. SIO2B3]
MLPENKSKKLPSPPDSQFWVDGIINELQEGIWSVDTNTNQFVYINQAVENIYGRHRNDFYENENLWLEVIYPSEQESVQDCLFKAQNTGKAEIEYHIFLSNGETRLLHHKFLYIATENHQKKYINSIITDISETQKLKSKLVKTQKESETQTHEFQRLTHNIPGIIYQWKKNIDGSDKFIYISPNCQEICELDPADVQQNSALMWELVHPDDLEAFWKSIAAAAQTLNNWQFKWRIITKSGIVKWLSGIAQSEKQSNGDLVWYGVLLDISEQQTALHERKQTEVALQKSEARNRAFLEAIPDLLFRLNKEGKYLDFKAPNEDDLAVPVNEIIGRNIKEMLPLPVAQLFLDNIELTVSTRKLQVSEYQLVTISGELQDFEARFSVVDDSEEVFIVVRNITERKQAELALRESERRFRAVFDSMFQFMGLLEPNGTILEVNQTYLNLFTIDNIEFVGLPFWELPGWLPETISKIEKSVNSARKGEFVRYEVDVKKNDGNLLTIDVSIKPIFDEAKNVVLLIAEGRDISERKRAELERDRFFTVSLDLLCIGGFDGYFKRINPAWEDIFGYTQKELLSTPFIQIVHPEDRYATIKVFQQNVGGQMVVNFENRCQARNGSYKWLSWNVVSFPNDRLIYAIARDVSDRKRAELALQHSEAKFREIAVREALINRINSMIRNSLELDTILDNTVAEIYNHLQVNLCCFAWYRPDEIPFWQVVKEAKASNINSCLGDYPEAVYRPISQKLLNLEICQIDDICSIEDVDLQQIFRDIDMASILALPIRTLSDEIGALICYRCGVAPPWMNSEIELLQAVCNQLEIALNQAELYQQSCASVKYANTKNEQLEKTLLELKRTQSQLIQAEKMSSLGQLVAGIAHEINNPVNFIFGNLTYAGDYITDILGLIKLYQETYPQTTPEIADEIERIELDFLVEDVVKLFNSMKTGAERIREIVKSLRTFSRLDEAEVKEVDIHENIDSTLMILQSRLKRKPNYPSINLIKDYGKLPLIECYPGQLNQVFMNIIANAIDALEDRDQGRKKTEVQANRSTITVRTRIDETNRAQIRVCDNGVGIRKEVIDKIFDPFYTTKPIGKGTGLGLSISYQIVVDKHHGNLYCISELGVGTEFIIDIPLKQSSLT